MTFKGHLFSSTRLTGYRSAFRRLRDEGGHDDAAAAEAARIAAEKAAADKAAAEAAAAEAAAKDKLSAEAKAALEAKEAELAELKAKLAGFEGIDPEVAKANAKKVEEAEKAATEAKAAAKKAEKEKAAAENDVAKLREIQAEEHKAEVDRIRAEKEASENAVTSLQQQLNNIRVENAFNGAKFITEETILTGGKAQRLFGDYVEVEDGKIVVYDAPRGDSKRAKVMDSKGNPLPFNDAITKVINADPDKDSLLKSKTKPGTGSSTTNGKPAQQAKPRLQRLAEGLAAMREARVR